MHSTRKNTKWYSGMRVHIGADPYYGFVHAIISTAANVAEGKVAPGLLREDDAVIYVDAGYGISASKCRKSRFFNGLG